MAKETLGTQVKHSVRLAGVGATVGPFTVDIIDKWVEWDGKRVTEVPEGEKFKVIVKYHASNALGASILNPWSTCVTVISTDGLVKGEDHDMHTTTPVDIRAEIPSLGYLGYIPKPLVMPDHDIDLRIKVWCNQSNWAMPGVPDFPPSDSY